MGFPNQRKRPRRTVRTARSSAAEARRYLCSAIRRRCAQAIASASLDYNPIENAFSKLKALLRKAERTIDGLWNTIGALLPSFTPREFANFFAAVG